MNNLILFSTGGCHLCEDAELLLHTLRRDGLIESWQVIDIADSDELIERYGVRIPVVQHDKQELGWPFTIDELKLFLWPSP